MLCNVSDVIRSSLHDLTDKMGRQKSKSYHEFLSLQSPYDNDYGTVHGYVSVYIVCVYYINVGGVSI